jgi:ribosomal protein L11 methyltransferase
MDSKTYFCMEITGVPVADEDRLTSDLFEGGACGVQENLQFQQTNRSYQPEVLPSESKTLLVYFESPPTLDWLEALKVEYPQLQLMVSEHEQEDWLGQWKEQWRPFEWVEGFWIVPDWEREHFTPEKGQAIYIEPGMAFGTGTHATTQLAAELILIWHQAYGSGSVLDVGTGSGILLVLANHLHMQPLYAYDNDPESFRVFSENMQKNGVTQTKWEPHWAENLVGQVDLTVANIIDGVLLDLKPSFTRVSSPFYLFTGILAERESAFLKEMTAGWNLHVRERLEKDEWVGFLMEMPR